MCKRLLTVLALSLVAVPLAAQVPTTQALSENGNLLDRVVAVVGDTVVLMSEVQEEILRMQAAGQFPADPIAQEEMIAQLVSSQVDQLVLLEAAQRAGTEVPEEQVQTLVDQNLASVQQRFGTEAAFREALEASGLTLEQYRYELQQQQRAELMRQQFIGSQLRGRSVPLVSEDQIRRAFEQQRASLGERPATVTLQQVIIKPEPTDSALAVAHRQAEQVLKELGEGADFEVLARRYSDDGSAERGGDLGWFRRERMVPEFANAAFALRPGQTSGIVQTEFGYHIIKVERARGPERHARHILIRPDITEADIAEARARVDSVAAALRGGADVRQLARQYDTPSEEAEIANIPLDRLPPAYSSALADAGDGDVVAPIELPGSGTSRYAVVRVVERTEAGPYQLDDVRDRLRQRLEEQAMIEQLIEELRNTVYVHVSI